MGSQRHRIGGVVAALLLSGVTTTSTALADSPTAAAAPAEQAPTVNVTARVTTPAVPVIGGTLTIGVKVTLADPGDDLPIPHGEVELSTDGAWLGTAAATVDPKDPSAMSAQVNVTGLGIAGKPGAVLSPGLHQIDATYIPTGGGKPTHGGVAVRVSFKDYLPGGSFYEDILWLVLQP